MSQKTRSIINIFFADDYKNKLEYVVNCLRIYDEDKENIKIIATRLVEAYCTSEKYSILEDSTEVFQAFMEEYFRNLKVIADVLNGTLNQGMAR